jgi:hypothetical protein
MALCSCGHRATAHRAHALRRHCLTQNRTKCVVVMKLEAQWAEPVSLTFRSILRKLDTEPSIFRFQRRIFFFIEITRNKNCLWWPCLLMDRNEMSNRYRGPSIDASYQDLVHLAKRFQRRFVQIGESETSIACGNHVY